MNFRNKILKLILFLDFIFLSKQQETRGIYEIIEDIQYPIVFDANEECFNVISDRKFYVYYKESNIRKSFGDSNLVYYAPPLLLKNKNNNYAISSLNFLYQLNLNLSNEIIGINNVEEYNFQIFGYMSEEILYSSINGNIDSNQSEIIIYGTNNNNLYFYYQVENKLINTNINENFDDYLSCKIYKHDHFIICFKFH